MKKVRRIFSLVLVLACMLGLSSGAFADEDTKPGSIIINNAAVGSDYKVYRILDLVSYDSSSEAYLYKTNTTWADFITEFNNNHKITSGNNIGYPITLNQDGYVTSFSFEAETFAKEAMDYVTDHKIEQNGGAQADANGVVSISGLDLGYYLVGSGTGSLVLLDTTKPTMTLTAKNTAPTVEKKIIVGNDRSDYTTASIGDEISFRVNITAYKGAENYILHDQMDEGLTFNSQSITIMDTDSKAIASENYTVVTEDIDDGCTFHVVFTEDYLNSIDATTTIRVHYKATLNSKAKVVSTATDTNDNKAHLTYGEYNYATTDSVVKVRTYQVQLVKSDEEWKVLTGATFRLYDQETEGNEIQVVKVSDGVYRVAATDAEKESAVAIEAGTPVIQGLGNGNYYLEEVTAPAGYNKVESRVLFTVNNTSNMAVFTDATNTVYDNSKGGGVLVKNSKGILLPNTGGTGILFLYVGGVLLVAAGCLLALRRRKKNS